jgi:DNA-binding MarR family transcriptional regulator
VDNLTETPELRFLDALFRLNKSVLAEVRTHIAAVSGFDLADFVILRTIEIGVDTPGGLVRELGLNPAVVSRALTKLARAGLIVRQIDPDDSRRSRVAITDKGAGVTAEFAARVRPGLAKRLRSLAPDQVQALLESFEALLPDAAEPAIADGSDRARGRGKPRL